MQAASVILNQSSCSHVKQTLDHSTSLTSCSTINAFPKISSFFGTCVSLGSCTSRFRLVTHRKVLKCLIMEEGSSSKFKRICVFCGSNSGLREVFSVAATELGDEMVKRKITLVYGGGSVGLMGMIAQRVFDGGCHVLGIIPKVLVPIEMSVESVGEIRMVSDMHERKAAMAREADAFIALPGGYGTMEEVLEMITWSNLGFHKKPVGLLNVDGYYNNLLAQFDNGVKEGFINPSGRDVVLSASNALDLLTKMEQYTPAHDYVAPHESL